MLERIIRQIIVVLCTIFLAKIVYEMFLFLRIHTIPYKGIYMMESVSDAVLGSIFWALVLYAIAIVACIGMVLSLLQGSLLRFGEYIAWLVLLSALIFPRHALLCSSGAVVVVVVAYILEYGFLGVLDMVFN